MSYSSKVEQELRFFRSMADVHALPAIYHYWSDKYLRPKFESVGFSSPNDFYLKYIRRMAQGSPESYCRVLSLGAGNCDTEVELVAQLKQDGVENIEFNCLDLNAEMLDRGKQLAAERNIARHFRFIEADLNHWNADNSYEIIIASQSLHHFVDLELLFEKTFQGLADDGFFLTNDMIGRNGHLRWPEALTVVQALWSLLDEKYKWNHQLSRLELEYENWDCSTEGFEGVRAQDILPLLLKTFHFECFFGWANLISIFIDRSFGHNFDIGNSDDRRFIDLVAGLDDYFIESGSIKPTQMIAAMTKRDPGERKVYKHLTPEFCVRDPSL